MTQITNFDNRELEARGLTVSTVDRFEIRRHSTGSSGVYWEYPTHYPDGAPGPKRRKFRNPEQQALYNRPELRYAWSDASEPDKPATYNLHETLRLLNLDSEANVWLVGGEVEVWLFKQESIPAFSILPRSQNPEDIGDGIEEAFSRLSAVGASHIHVFPASNDEDRLLLGRIYRASRAHNLHLKMHDWALPLKSERYDLADYWEDCREAQTPFLSAILDMPVVENDTLRVWDKAAQDWQETRRKVALEQDAKAAAVDSAADEDEEQERLCDYYERMAMAAPPGKKSPEQQYLDLAGFLQRDNGLDAQLWRTNNQEHFFSAMWKGRRETHNIDGSRFGYFVDEIARDKLGYIMTQEGIRTAQKRFAGDADQIGRMAEISPRIAGSAGRIYIDLATRQNEVVEIGEGIESGWRVTTQYHGIFRRADGHERLPRPVHNADNAAVWREFKALFNPGTQSNWVLMIGWLFAAMRPPTAPYPGLVIAGEQDSGKSVRSRMLKLLLDPNTRDVGSNPKDERDLFITAQNQWVPAIDNTSGITREMSDAYCRIATSGRFATRKLRTDEEEKVFMVKRPLLFNGIDSNMGRDDFKRRMIFVELPRLESKNKEYEEEIYRRFYELRPKVLGALCDAVALALKQFREVPRVDVGRGLPDADRWIRAGERFLPWKLGDWHKFYMQNLGEVAQAGANAPFPTAVKDYIDEYEADNGKGAISTIRTQALCIKLMHFGALQQLDPAELALMSEFERSRVIERQVESLKRDKSFPTDANWCGRELKRIANLLLEVGIDARAGKKAGHWIIKRVPVKNFHRSDLGEQRVDSDFIGDDPTAANITPSERDRLNEMLSALPEDDPFDLPVDADEDEK